jgi:hypothetical protein
MEKKVREFWIRTGNNALFKYKDFAPGGGLPNIKKALEAANDLWQVSGKQSK